MSTAPTVTSIQREPELLGQIVVVIGGSAGIGLETARRARAEGAEVILAGRNPDRLEHAARELGALSSAAFDAADADRLAGFFQALPTPIDHVLVTAGRPYYTSLADMDFEQAHREVDEHLWLALHVAREAAGKMRPGGTLLFMSGTAARRPGVGGPIVSALTAGLPALTATLALELAPVRVNLIAAGFVDISARRAARGAPPAVARHAPDRPCRRTRRGRRTRRAPHDQHRSHGRDLRHRRRPAARLADNV